MDTTPNLSLPYIIAAQAQKHVTHKLGAVVDATPATDSMPTALVFSTTPSGSPTASERLRVESGGTVRPGADNTQSIGSASFRWSTVYAGTGTINTSDARRKQVRGSLTEAELAAWGRVQWQVYQWCDAIAQKGEAGARLHAGLVAQQVEAAFAAEGLDARRYALFCEDDELEAVVVGEGETGPITELRPTGAKRLGLRYDQCLAFEAAWVRTRIASL